MGISNFNVGIIGGGVIARKLCLQLRQARPEWKLLMVSRQTEEEDLRWGWENLYRELGQMEMDISGWGLGDPYPVENVLLRRIRGCSVVAADCRAEMSDLRELEVSSQSLTLVKDSVLDFRKRGAGWQLWFDGNETVAVDHLVLAIGGGRNRLHSILREQGHFIHPSVPLYQRYIPSGKFSKKNVAFEIALAKGVYQGDSFEGSAIYSPRGLEGSVLNQCATFLYKQEAYNPREGMSLVFDWLPEVKAAQLRFEILKLIEGNYKLADGWRRLQVYLPVAFILMLQETVAFNEDRWGRISSKGVNKIVQQIKQMQLELTPKGLASGYRAWGGGLDSRSWNWQTGESHFQERLYFIGEILDITGPTERTHFALNLISAVICAEAIIHTQEG